METLLERENYFSNIIFLENIPFTPLEESCDSFLNNHYSETISSIDDTIIFFVSKCFGLVYSSTEETINDSLVDKLSFSD
jgi:hypothetical protein